MWEAMEQWGWVKTLSSTGWMYASVSVIHYLTMFWFIGSMAVVDLRVMGIAASKRNLSELAEQIFPWAWTGMVLAIVSGFFMFLTDAGDWAPDPGISREAGNDHPFHRVRGDGTARRPKVGRVAGDTDLGKSHRHDCFGAVDPYDSERVGDPRDGRPGLVDLIDTAGADSISEPATKKKRGRAL